MSQRRVIWATYGYIICESMRMELQVQKMVTESSMLRNIFSTIYLLPLSSTYSVLVKYAG